MKILNLTLILAFGTICNFAKASSLENFCIKISEPAVVEEYTPEGLKESQHYSFARALEGLYIGKNFSLKNDAELVQHQLEVTKEINKFMQFMGYSVTVEQVLYCSNKNSANIDFNLLRFALYHSLKKVYIF